MHLVTPSTVIDSAKNTGNQTFLTCFFKLLLFQLLLQFDNRYSLPQVIKSRVISFNIPQSKHFLSPSAPHLNHHQSLLTGPLEEFEHLIMKKTTTGTKLWSRMLQLKLTIVSLSVRYPFLIIDVCIPLASCQVTWSRQRFGFDQRETIILGNL